MKKLLFLMIAIFFATSNSFAINLLKKESFSSQPRKKVRKHHMHHHRRAYHRPKSRRITLRLPTPPPHP